MSSELNKDLLGLLLLNFQLTWHWQKACFAPVHDYLGGSGLRIGGGGLLSCGPPLCLNSQDGSLEKQFLRGGVSLNLMI